MASKESNADEPSDEEDPSGKLEFHETSLDSILFLSDAGVRIASLEFRAADIFANVKTKGGAKECDTAMRHQARCTELSSQWRDHIVMCHSIKPFATCPKRQKYGNTSSCSCVTPAIDVINDRNFNDALREVDGGGWELPAPDSDYEALLATDERRVGTLLGNLFLCMQAAEANENATNSIAVALFGQEGVRLGRPLGQLHQESASSSGQAQPVVAAVGKRKRLAPPSDCEQGEQLSWPCVHDDSAVIPAKLSKRLEAMAWTKLLKLNDAVIVNVSASGELAIGVDRCESHDDQLRYNVTT